MQLEQEIIHKKSCGTYSTKFSSGNDVIVECKKRIGAPSYLVLFPSKKEYYIEEKGKRTKLTPSSFSNFFSGLDGDERWASESNALFDRFSKLENFSIRFCAMIENTFFEKLASKGLITVSAWDDAEYNFVYTVSENLNNAYGRIWANIDLVRWMVDTFSYVNNVSRAETIRATWSQFARRYGEQNLYRKIDKFNSDSIDTFILIADIFSISIAKDFFSKWAGNDDYGALPYVERIQSLACEARDSGCVMRNGDVVALEKAKKFAFLGALPVSNFDLKEFETQLLEESKQFAFGKSGICE